MTFDWRSYQVKLPAGQDGVWAVEHFTVRPGTPLRHCMHESSVLNRELDRVLGAAEPDKHVEPGTYTRLVRATPEAYDQVDLVMSDARPEIEEHREFFERAHGEVLIHGLGLGMCLLGVARKPEVTGVTVVERAMSVIRLVAPHVQHPKLRGVVHADALEWDPPRYYDTVWSDIWTFIDERNLDDMAALQRRYLGRCGWHGHWAQDQCERRRAKLRAVRAAEALSRRFRVSDPASFARGAYAVYKGDR